MTDWTTTLGPEKEKSYFQSLLQTVHQARLEHTIYPPASEVFNAFKLTALEDIKVVILGQDPYHGPHQAHGLAFSVRPEVRIPPSLQNIYKELATDIEGFVPPSHGFLKSWAKQGVFLLNTVLTVQQGLSHSHAGLGWETFTDEVLRVLNEEREHLVFMLWGSHAQKKGSLIDSRKHLILKAPHPSPLSAYRGFFGCRHFSKANAYLAQHGIEPVDWQLPAVETLADA